jgi:hypothetical protein
MENQGKRAIFDSKVGRQRNGFCQNDLFAGESLTKIRGYTVDPTQQLECKCDFLYLGKLTDEYPIDSGDQYGFENPFS